MNNIHRLQADNTTLTDALDTVDGVVADLFRYLTSDKFHQDPTVQVDDVMRRLAPLRTLPRPR